MASGLTGAPANGVRFVLYAVDPVMLRPVEPVVEVGYADIIDQSTASTTDIRVKVVAGERRSTSTTTSAPPPPPRAAW